MLKITSKGFGLLQALMIAGTLAGSIIYIIDKVNKVGVVIDFVFLLRFRKTLFSWF